MKLHKSLLLFGASALLLTACGEDGSSVEDTSSAEEPEIEEVADDAQGDESEEVKTSSEQSEETEDAAFDGTTLVTDDITIEIKDYKVLQPGEENNFGDVPLIAFWYDITVHEGVEEEITPSDWIFHFEAVQDNDPNAINTLEVGILPDDAHLDSQMETIKPGGTVESSMSYELDDLETPVTLIASEMFGEELGRHDYELNQ